MKEVIKKIKNNHYVPKVEYPLRKNFKKTVSHKCNCELCTAGPEYTKFDEVGYNGQMEEHYQSIADTFTAFRKEVIEAVMNGCEDIKSSYVPENIFQTFLDNGGVDLDKIYLQEIAEEMKKIFLT